MIDIDTVLAQHSRTVATSRSNHSFEKTMLFVQPNNDEGCRLFAAAIKMLRITSGLNQTELGMKFNLTQSRWSNIETSDIVPIPAVVFAIEDYFGITNGCLAAMLGYARTTITPNQAFALAVNEIQKRAGNGNHQTV